MTLRILSVLIIALTGTGFFVTAMAQTDHSMHGSPVAKPAASASAADLAMGDGVVK